MEKRKKYLVLESDGDIFNTFEDAEQHAKEVNSEQESDICEIFELTARYASETTTVFKKVPL